MISVQATAMQSVELQRYARRLDAGARIGLTLLVLSSIASRTGLLQAAPPPHRLPASGSLPGPGYPQQTQTSVGWGWLTGGHA